MAEIEHIDLLSNELDKVKNSKDISDGEKEKILDYIKSKRAQNLILSPNLLSSFLNFAQDVGLPATRDMVEYSLGSNKKKADAAITALKAAKILDTYSVAGGVMKDIIRRTWKDDKEIKKNPEDEIEVFDYHPDFISELGLIIGKLKLKSEEIMSSKKIIQEGKEILNKLRREIEVPHLINEAHEPRDDESDFFNHLSDDVVEQLMDGLLLVVSELEAQGKIKKFKKPSDAKTALMAAIRKMYQSRGLVGKEARKLQKSGSKKIIRQAKRDIQKAQ